jgi:Leucine-rich repeat (LRR) protein
MKQLERLHGTFSLFRHVPSSIGDLLSLKHLDLGCGAVSCDLPASMGKLTNLETLNIDPRNLPKLPVSVLDSWRKLRMVTFRLDDAVMDPIICFHEIPFQKSIPTLNLEIGERKLNNDEDLIDDFNVEEEDSDYHPTMATLSLISLGPHLQKLKELAVSNSEQTPVGLNIQDLRDCNNLTRLRAFGCRFLNRTEGPSPPRIVLPELVNLEWFLVDKQDISIVSVLDLPRLERLSVQDCQFDSTDELDQLCTNLISRCTHLKLLSLYGSEIEDISSEGCAALPTGVISLDISCTPLATGRSPDQVDTTRKCLWRLARSVPNLYDINGVHWDYYFSEEEQFDFLSMMSLKKGKYCVLNDQPVSLSMWPLVLANANKAFKSDVHAKEDAIHILLKERYVMEALTVNHSM